MFQEWNRTSAAWTVKTLIPVQSGHNYQNQDFSEINKYPPPSEAWEFVYIKQDNSLKMYWVLRDRTRNSLKNVNGISSSIKLYKKCTVIGVMFLCSINSWCRLN